MRCWRAAFPRYTSCESSLIQEDYPYSSICSLAVVVATLVSQPSTVRRAGIASRGLICASKMGT